MTVPECSEIDCNKEGWNLYIYGSHAYAVCHGHKKKLNKDETTDSGGRV